MIDEGQRHRRKVLGWALITLALLLLLVVVLFGRVLMEQIMLGTMSNSYALVTAFVLIFLALAGSGVYLLQTVRGR